MSLFHKTASYGRLHFAAEARRERRVDVSEASPPYRAEMNGALAHVLDISDGGFCIELANGAPPQRCTATVYRGEGVYLKAAVVLAWWKDQKAGDQVVDMLERPPRGPAPTGPRKPAAVKRTMAPAPESNVPRPQAPMPTVSGQELRARLRRR